ncbi:MAG: exosome complex exonuclease Rrp41, partial [Desulfurococcales archaeon]|nr:exosome complex exonuclease Rrp41 [Desulfurococcales archaeon]
DMPVAAAPDIGKITLFQLNGVLTREEVEKGLDMALEAIKKLVELEKQTLVEEYVTTEEV